MHGAAARREGASAAELDAAVGLVALDALRIAARSAHNRAALQELGALPGLVGLMKVHPEPQSPMNPKTRFSAGGGPALLTPSDTCHTAPGQPHEGAPASHRQRSWPPVKDP